MGSFLQVVVQTGLAGHGPEIARRQSAAISAVKVSFANASLYWPGPAIFATQ